MAMDFRELNEETRGFMKEELDWSIENDKVYSSTEFVGDVKDDYIKLLEEAITNHEEEWLRKKLTSDFFVANNPKTGRTVNKEFAAKRLAQTEFNRFYTRGICRKALDQNSNYVEVYRARESKDPDPKSEAQIGERAEAEKLLQNLRNKPVHEIDFPRVNSGLSVKTI